MAARSVTQLTSEQRSKGWRSVFAASRSARHCLQKQEPEMAIAIYTLNAARDEAMENTGPSWINQGDAPNDEQWNAGEIKKKAAQQTLADLIRDIIGNPYRPFQLDPVWLTWNGGLVRRLAEAVYENRRLPDGALDVERMAVLADGLEEAGCSDAEILNHCRTQEKHVRGCWLVDSILGRC